MDGCVCRSVTDMDAEMPSVGLTVHIAACLSRHGLHGIPTQLISPEHDQQLVVATGQRAALPSGAGLAHGLAARRRAQAPGSAGPGAERAPQNPIRGRL